GPVRDVRGAARHARRGRRGSGRAARGSHGGRKGTARVRGGEARGFQGAKEDRIREGDPRGCDGETPAHWTRGEAGAWIDEPATALTRKLADQIPETRG